MIALAVLITVVLTSLCWLLILGLCLSAKDRDELEARTYLPLYPPDIPDWVNNGDDAA